MSFKGENANSDQPADKQWDPERLLQGYFSIHCRPVPTSRWLPLLPLCWVSVFLAPSFPAPSAVLVLFFFVFCPIIIQLAPVVRRGESMMKSFHNHTSTPGSGDELAVSTNMSRISAAVDMSGVLTTLISDTSTCTSQSVFGNLGTRRSP